MIRSNEGSLFPYRESYTLFRFNDLLRRNPIFPWELNEKRNHSLFSAGNRFRVE